MWQGFWFQKGSSGHTLTFHNFHANFTERFHQFLNNSSFDFSHKSQSSDKFDRILCNRSYLDCINLIHIFWMDDYVTSLKVGC